MRFAALFAALFAAASTSAVNITHHADAQLFSYVEDGPLLSAWSEDIPPEYIPGGVAPSDAVARLTDEQTRLAFVGTFDAYLRRFLASHAFGTADTREYVAAREWITNYIFKIRNKEDWLSDKTTLPLIGGHLGSDATNGWACASNRIYAVTNITLAVTNWVGWTTNVVRLTNGHYRVSISNRYNVTQKQIPDTTRILERYKDGHDYVRGALTKYLPGNPNGTKYLLSVQPDFDEYLGKEDYGLYGYRWPARRDIATFDTSYHLVTNESHGVKTVELHTNHTQQVIWPENTNIGWSWSQISGFADVPLGVDPYAWDNGGKWRERLSYCFDDHVWGWLYPTTWDIWSRTYSRAAVSAAFSDMCGANQDGLYDYQYLCEDDWNYTLGLIERNQVETREYLTTNHIVVVFTNDLTVPPTVYTNEYDEIIPIHTLTLGYTMLTNLVELCPADKPETHIHTNIVATATGLVTNVVEVVVTNLQDRMQIVPERRTSQRINWTEWTGTDGFLALTDTSLIGPAAMPKLRYDTFATNAHIRVDYATPDNMDSGIVLYGYGEQSWGDNYGWRWGVAPMTEICRVGRTDVSVSGGRLYTADISDDRREGIVVRSTFPYADGRFQPGTIIQDGSEHDPGVGVNCVIPSVAYHRGLLSRLAVAYENSGHPLSVGDVVYFDYRWSAEGKKAVLPYTVSGWVWGWVMADRVSEYDVGIPFVASTLVDEFNGSLFVDINKLFVTAFSNIDVVSTKDQPRPYQYNLNLNMLTNSVPCGYPNPSYARDDNVDGIVDIKASVFSAIASTTNFPSLADRDYPTYDSWDTNGYLFAFSSATGNSARGVDAFVRNMDDALRDKLKAFVGEARGITPSDDMDEVAGQVVSQVDSSILADDCRLLVEAIEDVINNGYVSPGISTYYDPCFAKITSITPTGFHSNSDDPGEWFDISYQVVRPKIATNDQHILYYEWVPTDEKLRRCWSGSTGPMGFTNELIKAGGRVAHGRLSGMEAVRWNFKAMKPARQLP